MRNPCSWPVRIALAILVLSASSACNNEDDVARNEVGIATDSGAGSGASTESAATHPWNLVVITMDTTRTDAIGAYGQALDITPHLDRLAAEGVLFEEVGGSSPTTLPSHATLFTGKFPFEHGARSNIGYALSDSNLTLAEVLAEAGYATGAEIAAAVLQSQSQIEQGYQSVRDTRSVGVELRSVARQIDLEKYEEPIRMGSDISKRGIEFMRKHAGRPFHLWLHYFEPHRPWPLVNDFRARFPDNEYLAEVALMDDAIGSVVDEIRRLGLRDKTLVVVTADHGEGLGDHGEKTHGYFVYESTMRVPWILWGPGELPKGRRVGGFARSVDIAPTVLDLMQHPPLSDIAGVSLKGAVLGTEKNSELIGYGESVELNRVFDVIPLRYLRAGRWKYIHKVAPELYDLEADPDEASNLASQRPEIVERMQARLRTMLASKTESGSESERQVDARTRAELAALGYIASESASAAELDDEIASLELRGADAAAKIGDVDDLTIAQGFIQLQDHAQALSLLEPLLERNPDSIVVQAALASALFRVGRVDEAKGLMRSVLEGNGCADDTRGELKKILLAQKRYNEAINLLGESPEDCPSYSLHRNNLAYLLATLPIARLRDGERALETIRDAIATMRGQPDPGFLDTLAAAHAELGDFQEAVRVQNQALEILREQKVSPAVLAAYQAHLRLFESQKPVREP